MNLPFFDRISEMAIVLVALALVAIGGAAGGWIVAQAKNATTAELRETAARAQAAQAEHASRRLAEAQALGDRLTNDLAAAVSAGITAQEQRDEALREVTTGRRCLNSAALRVLDGAGAAGHQSGLPAPAGGAAAAGGSAAADAAAEGDYATDTDVSLWASHARRQYDECRGRLDALIDFNLAGDLQ